MPPKKPLKKRETTSDWDWVGTEVTRVEDITPQHRKRAAGLIGGEPCTPRYLPINPPSHTLDYDDAISVTASDASIKFVKEVAKGDVECSQKRCRGWHLCLNYLGGEEVTDSRGKKQYMVEKLGSGVVMRKGPAGLRNLGATCYVSMERVLFDREDADRIRRMLSFNFGFTIYHSGMECMRVYLLDR
jgi:ubiquitin carboxyl-terminal hydrolase 48